MWREGYKRSEKNAPIEQPDEKQKLHGGAVVQGGVIVQWVERWTRDQ